MRVRSASDLLYTVIAWMPLLMVATAAFYAVALGIMHLELVTPGAGLFIDDSHSANALPTGTGGAAPTRQELLDAIASGDVDHMNAVYDRYEQHRSNSSID